MLDFQDLADLGFTVSISNLDNFAPMASKRIERRWLKRIAGKSCVGGVAVGGVVRVTAVRQQSNRRTLNPSRSRDKS